MAILPAETRRFLGRTAIAQADRHAIIQLARQHQARILFWDRTDCCIMGKKLAQGRFRLGRELPETATHIEVEAAELSLVLEGFLAGSPCPGSPMTRTSYPRSQRLAAS